MASDINPNNIDGTYPIAGIDNDTQGFRTNFTNTSTNFASTKAEIEDLQNNAILKGPLDGESTTDNTLTVPLNTAASDTTLAGLNIAEGVAPAAPVDGDVWVTAAGEFFARLNGVTTDLAGGGGGVEGSAVLSTGELGGTKFLREDGDGTSSWQTVPAAGLSNIVEDTTPQLGGNLDINGFTILTVASDDTLDINILAGTTNYDNDESQASGINIVSGDHLSTTDPGNGGDINITSGGVPGAADGGDTRSGGTINITGGDVPDANLATGGPINIHGGSSYASAGSSIGGKIHIKGGEAYDFPGDVWLEAGGAYGNQSPDGMVVIRANDYAGTLGGYGGAELTTVLAFEGLQSNTTLGVTSGRVSDNFVGIRAPANIGVTPYIITLPATAPTTGQVLEVTLGGANALTSWTTPSDLGEFTVAGLPAAASNANSWALATNASGGRTTVRSDGTNWKVMAVEGATVST